MITRDPGAATTLAELAEIMNEWSEAIDHSDSDVEDYPTDTTQLPTFGGPDVEHTMGVWSWDATSILVAEGGTTGPTWVIQRRCSVCGEATFHCEHGEDPFDKPDD